MLIKKIFIVVFVMLLAVPFIYAPFYEAKLKHENRNRVHLPKYNKGGEIDFIKGLIHFLKNEFAFRDDLIKTYLCLKEDLFKTESMPQMVKKGKDGWLFLGDVYENVFAESLGIVSHREGEIGNVCENITAMDSLCAMLGVDYYCAIVANKHRIYKDKLPLTALKGKRRFDLVKDRMRKYTDVKFIDVSENFYLEKDTTKLYYHTDSHWTIWGGLVGCKKILNKLGETYKVASSLCKIDNYKIDSTLVMGMDLSRLIYKDYPEYHYDVVPKLDEMKYERSEEGYFKSNAENNLRVLVFNDSYYMALQNILPSYFKEVHSYWTGFNVEVVKQIQPDIVIFLRVERSLKDLERRQKYSL